MTPQDVRMTRTLKVTERRASKRTPARACTTTCMLPRTHAAALVIAAGFATALAPLAWAQPNTPGTGPSDPIKGQPGFAEPEPNAGEKPKTGDEPSKIAEAAKAAEPAPAADADPDKPTYLVSAVVVKFASEHPQLPAADDLLQREVLLGWRDGGYVEYSEGEEEAYVLLSDLAIKPPVRFTSRALLAVARAIVADMNERGIIGVSVSPSDDEFAPPDEGDPAWGKDIRKTGKQSLTLIVRAGIVSELRTIALGERFPGADRVNNPAHAEILNNSPVQVFREDDPERRDLLLREEVEEYVYRLNRHPGRRVDIAVSAAQQPGGIALDLLVNENKPWIAYTQISNTGTDSTEVWRERFGFVHNQLTNRDDILSIDYVTAGFKDSHAFIGSYDTPIYSDWLRFKPFFSWNQFTASDVGQTGEEFEGEGWKIGGELVANIYQKRELFIDAVLGARYEHIEVDNKAVDVKGDDNFFLPYIGLRLERQTDVNSTVASVILEGNLPDVADTNAETLNELGRLNPDDSWIAFQWDFNHSFYIEPLFFRSDWENPESSLATLAHEVSLSLRGQYAFDSRLVPNYEQVVGGLYTVRGYEESVVAGDSVVVFSAEYRFHLPQALGIDPNPGELFGSTFRYKPQQPYGRADWDLVLKGFLDIGRAVNSNRESFERDNTLIGTGVGAELLFKRNFSLRIDWGVALDEIEDTVSAGSNRFHIVGTLLF